MGSYLHQHASCHRTINTAVTEYSIKFLKLVHVYAAQAGGTLSSGLHLPLLSGSAAPGNATANQVASCTIIADRNSNVQMGNKITK